MKAMLTLVCAAALACAPITAHAQVTPAGGPSASGGARARTPGAAPLNEDAAVIAATREYQRSGRARSLEVGSFLVYPFGRSQPRVTCTLARACTVQLQEGEKPFTPYAGDNERWFIGTSPGPNNTMLVVVQPSDCNATTNLTIPTDRRIYHLTLDSPPCTARDTAQQNPDLPYNRMVRFYYPDELLTRLAANEQAQVQASQERFESEVPVAVPAFDPAALDFAYFMCRDRAFPWRPEQVFADARALYIKIPAEASTAPPPALFELGPGGELVLINYVPRAGYYVADRLVRRAVLVVGNGQRGSEQRLLITKNRKDCRQ